MPVRLVPPRERTLSVRLDDEVHTDLVRRTVSTVAAACCRHRLPTAKDLRVFRVLAVRCSLAGMSLDEVLATVKMCVDRPQLLVIPRATCRSDTSSPQAITRTRWGRAATADAVAQRVQDELIAGYAATTVHVAPAAERVAAMRAALDGAGSAEYSGRDVDTLRSVAVFYGNDDDLERRLQRAGEDAEILLTYAVDIGTAATPPHRRVVFAGWSPRTWREAADTLAAISERYELVVRITVGAPGLRRLGAVYRQVVDGLPWSPVAGRFTPAVHAVA